MRGKARSIGPWRHDGVPVSQENTRVCLTVPSRLDHLDLLQELAEATARIAGFAEDQRLDLGLAVREAAINAMKHGNRLDPRREVKATFTCNAESMHIAILDQGNGFDPGSVPDPTAPENLLRSSGRGLLLIRTLVEEVEFHRTSSGMEIVLSKRLPRAPAR